MKNSKRDKIRLMKYQDANGIIRSQKKAMHIPIGLYTFIKIALIAAIPMVYFLYSPLLLVVVIAYIALLILTCLIEKEQNDGLRKDLRIHLSKTDSFLCVLLIIIAVVGCVIGSFSMGQRKSMFEGIDQSQIGQSLQEFDFSSSKLKTQQVENKIKEFMSLMTGTRRLFVAEKTFGRFSGGGKFGGMGSMGGSGMKPPEGFTFPNGKPPKMNDTLQNMPLSTIFKSIVQAVNTALLVVVCFLGVFSLYKMKKFGLYKKVKIRKQVQAN